MAKIVGPDPLNRNTELVFDLNLKTIQLVPTGNLFDTSPAVDSGVTLQAVYSKCKELWNSETDLNKFRFPFDAITEAKMDLINGWTWADATTIRLIRDGGWSIRDGAGNATEMYMGIISLGTFPDAHQAYYQQEAGFEANVSETEYTGVINEPVKIMEDGIFDFRDFFKLFLRVFERTYAVSDLIQDQGFVQLDYIVYRLPLSSIIDPNIIDTDGDVDIEAPYTGMTIDYLRGNGFTTWVSEGEYSIDDVVLDDTVSPGRWFRALTNHDGVVTAPNADATNWEPYEGEEQIGENYYAFNRIIDANNGTAQQIYTFMQRQLRQTGDINDNVSTDNFGTVNGNVAVSFGGMVGPALVTNGGVVVRNFNVDDRVNMQFNDITVDGGGLDDEFIPLTSTTRIFPFVSTGTIVPNPILIDDPDAVYTMYFDSVLAGDFDTEDAVIVEDDEGNPLQGPITGDIPFTFDYDGNDQGGRTPGTDAAVTIVAIGLNTAQYVTASFTITRTVGLVFPINAVLERNYVAGG